jgi:hypothetical protein
LFVGLTLVLAGRAAKGENSPSGPGQGVGVDQVYDASYRLMAWIVEAGGQSHLLWPAGATDWSGLDTTIHLTPAATHVVVVAEDREGRLVARSAPVVVAS